MRRIAILMAAAVLAVSVSCKKEGPASSDPFADSNIVAITSVTIRAGSTGTSRKEISLTMKERQVVTLETTVTPSAATEKVTFKCDDSMVARVSRKGVITARGAGVTDIHVLAGATEMAVCHLTVERDDVVVTEFAVDVAQVETEWGKDAHVFVNKVVPSTVSVGDVYFGFVSSDEEVFTVETEFDGFGCVVHALKPGSGVLTVSLEGQSVQVPVTVKKKPLVALTNWVYTSPETDYKIERPVWNKDYLEGRILLYNGFFSHAYLVDADGNPVRGKYGFSDYTNGTTFPYANAVYRATDSGIYMMPLYATNGKHSYDGMSQQLLTFESELYEFVGKKEIGAQTRASGFISFTEGDELELCIHFATPVAFSNAARYNAETQSYRATRGNTLDVYIASRTSPYWSSSGLNQYVFENDYGRYDWFTMRSENGLIEITDPYPGLDTSDWNEQRLKFVKTGTDYVTVSDKFGNTRSYKFFITTF